MRSTRTPPPALDAVVVRTPDGAAARLADLWRERPVVLAFVRHFG